MYDYDDYDGCPGCGRRDYGFEMSDVRGTYYIRNCRCKAKCVCTPVEQKDYADESFKGCICEDNGCDCDRITIKIIIDRVFDQQCSHCGGADYRCVYNVTKDGEHVTQCGDESDAHTYIERHYPDAEVPEPDYAWESERWLRAAGG